MFSSTFYQFLSLISGILTLFFGLIVFGKNRKLRLNQVFFFFTFSCAIWLFGSFAMLRSKTDEEAIFWDRIVYAGVVFIPTLAYHVSLLFCQIKNQKKLLFLGYFLSFFFLILSRTNYFIEGLYKYNWGVHTQARFFHHVFLIFFAFYFFLFFLNIYRFYRKTKGVEHSQAAYFLLASFVMIISSLGFLPAYGINLPPFSYFTTVIFILILTFAITRYHLFEIRVILTEILVGVMGLILLILPFLMETLYLRILTIGIFLLFCLFGYFLVRYTHKEISYKEEIQKAYEKLKEASKNIEELLKMKSQFLKVVSHQLRTPASIIKGMLSMMVEGSVKGEKLKEFLKKSYLSSERLTTILDDILVAQGLIGGGEPVKFSACQIEEIVERKVNEFKPRAEMKGLKISFSKPKEILPITLADSEMIERAISRLIDNAILYTEKGEIKVSVNLKRKGEKDFIEISVKDQGIGLDEGDKKNLFKLFYRGERATHLHPNGTGLGLFIVNEFVKIHKGEIKAESEGRGKGSNFIITLPVITEI